MPADRRTAPRSSRPSGILLYGMYDVATAGSAPKVRIRAMTAALSGRIGTESITGGRGARAKAAFRWLRSGGSRRVGAVYVESATTSAMPTDLLFLTIMRLKGRPVGVYFRDAYQLFRHDYPRRRRQQILSDLLWRVTTPILARIATHRFVASRGLADALGLRDATVLGPGADPGLPDLGPGSGPTVAYVGSHEWADGFGMLLEAMAIVHDRMPDARLFVTPPVPGAGPLPDYVAAAESSRDGLAALLADARACTIPRPKTAYTDLAVPVKLWDYLSFGKPVVATDLTETAAILEASGAGVATPATPEGLAEGLLQVLGDPALAQRLSHNARAFACAPGQTWDARAATVIEALGLAASATRETARG